jgi:hypothetical protein
MHEALFSDAFLKAEGFDDDRHRQGLIDEGYHPMTMYFPLVVHGAMLIEPTETESKATLDQFIGAQSASAILCINMTHIAPWAATLGLLKGAARLLRPGAPLILYGPFLRADIETAPSNAAFDAQLRARNPAYGIPMGGGCGPSR